MKPTDPQFSPGMKINRVVEPQTYRDNLPAQLTSFVGREEEIGQIKVLLQQTRLLTLTGSGGSGKTRLAIEAARQLSNQFEAGIRFVGLAPLEDPDLIANRIARVLGVEQHGAEPFWKILEHYLEKLNMLLLLDNFEHLLGAASHLTDLLSKAPQLTILVTSREPLRQYGEHEYLVEPLSLPPDIGRSVETLIHFPAIQLFVDRARQVRSSFQLNERTAVSVVAICQLLDGLPLAIELAAARLRLFGPEALLARLQGKKGDTLLSVLISHNRDRPDRQQTLRSAIDWSYHLLQPSEQQLFNQFAIFSGGADAAAVNEICLQVDKTVSETTNQLSDLVDKNLLNVIESESGEPRFQMLQVVREYAQERLNLGGDRILLGARHARYYFKLVKHLTYETSLSEAGVNNLEEEHNNIRAALNWTIQNNEATKQ